MTEPPCEIRVEAVTGIFGERVPLTQGGNGVGHGADSQAEVEGVAPPGAPRLKVGVTQAGEPRVVGGQPMVFPEEAEAGSR
jgi:hypothetical protein